MRKVLSVVLLSAASVLVGCATLQSGNQRREINLVPSWVIRVQLNNECTPHAALYQAGKGIVRSSVPKGQITNVTLTPPMLSDDNYVMLTFQVFATDGKTLLGSVDHTIPAGRGIISTASWKIGGAYWSSGQYNSQVLDAQGRDICKLNHVSE